MAGRRVHFVMDAELLARIDAALPLGVSRGEFVRRAVERKLAGLDAEQALVTDRRGSEDARVSFPAAPAPAERPEIIEVEGSGPFSLPESAEGKTVVVRNTERQGLRTPSVRRVPVPGPNVENIRSSAQSKRDVRPIPKRGER